jgi:hypothetical protein
LNFGQILPRRGGSGKDRKVFELRNRDQVNGEESAYMKIDA